MAMSDRHPSAERLAEYVDDVLSKVDRVDVERHLVDCADCRELVSDTMDVIIAEETVPDARSRVVPFRDRRWVRGVAAGLAAAAILVLAIRLVRPQWLGLGPRTDRPELQELIAALANEPTRPVEGRLSGGFHYAPPPSPMRGPAARDISPDTQIAVAKLEKTLRVTNSSRNRAALGIGYLVLGDAEKAVGALESASQESPHDAAYLSDLSAAYLARSAQGRPEDLPKALSAAERAIALNPDLREAYFNRALTLQALHLDDDAKHAWAAYERRETIASWKSEAATRARTVAEPQRSHYVPEARGLDTDLEAQAREFERLLDRAIAAVSARQTKDEERLSRELDRLGNSLTSSTGDHWFSDIASTFQVDSARVGLFRDGVRAYEKDQIADSSAIFTRLLVRPQRSSIAEWSRFYLTVGKYYANDLDGATRDLQELKSKARELRYLILCARVNWMMALLAQDTGRLREALTHYETARGIFVEARQPGQAAAIDVLRAGLFDSIGDVRESWRLRLAILTDQRRLEPRRLHTLLTSCVRAALSMNRPEAGTAFADAALENAVRWGQVGAELEALSYGARAALRSGRLSTATVLLDRASALSAQVKDQSLARRFDAELEITRAELSLVRRPPSVAAITTAIDRVAATGSISQLPGLYVYLSDAAAALQDRALAKSALRRGLEIVERQSRSLESTTAQAMLIDASWSLQERLIEYLIDWDGDLDGAVSVAEQFRALSVAARVSAVPSTLDIPNGHAVLYYFVAPKQTRVVVLRGHDRSLVRLPITSDSLEALADRVRREVSGPPSECCPALEDAYRVVIGPALVGIAAGDDLTIVADGPLFKFPFAALRAAGGTSLVTAHALTVVPFLGLSAGPMVGRKVSSLLAIGNPTVAARVLPPLPDAELEAREVTSIIPGSRLLVGASAKKSAVLRELSRSDAVHFAAHAVTIAAAPRLSYLVLSPESDGEAMSTLTALELARMNLQSIQLVVLSSCESIGGNALHGSGPISLASAFVAAGVPAVIGSLWSVEDAGSRQLFQSFYRALARGETFARALRTAQLDRQAHATIDRSWMAFELIGRSF